jgi:cyclophilin family peptidyl-prolyl cis-trans isomerase
MTRVLVAAACLLTLPTSLRAWVCPSPTKTYTTTGGKHNIRVPTTTTTTRTSSSHCLILQEHQEEPTIRDDFFVTSRRSWMIQSSASAIGLATCTSLPASAANSNNNNNHPSSTSTAQVTDRIFLEIKGLGNEGETKILVIGLFGKNAPRSTQMLKQLAQAKTGLAAPCRPKAERTLQKEQLEANKVYNSCLESQDKGVNYEYSQIWRIIPDERIDVGAVAGKFLARQYPTWQEEEQPQQGDDTVTTTTRLTHDSPGVVSVRRGDDSGFGFTIYPGSGSGTEAATLLDNQHIVVGKVETLDLVQELNQVPVIVTSSNLNYMGLTGGPTTKSAPTRACQYGGPMYCNEYKPLVKLSILNTGVL